MRRRSIFGWGFLGLTLVAVVGLAVLAPAQVAGSAEPCCFSNPQYDGVCTVVPGEGETCGSILAYLNNPMSTGKSYCGSTQIRGGWSQVDCGAGTSSAQPGAEPGGRGAGR